MKNNTEMTMPDFGLWTYNLFSNAGGCSVELEGFVEEALQQAFEQGMALGHREGYVKGSDFGWVYALESDENFIKQGEIAKQIMDEDKEVLRSLATKPTEE